MEVPVSGLVLDVDVQGRPDDEVVLLLHGFPQSSREWRRVVPDLVAAGFRTVAPDQRGYSPGARPHGVAAYRMQELVGDALGLLDALGLERVHVVGHDWGAAVAWQLAARHPQRCTSLTAISVPHPVAFTDALATDADQRARSQYMRDFGVEGTAEDTLLGDGPGRLGSFFGDLPDVEPYLAQMRDRSRLTACLNWYRASSRASVDDLPPVTVPTLYVWSDGDMALGRTAAEATGAHVDGDYRFVELSGVSHWVPEEAPERLLGPLLEHLRGQADHVLA